MKSVYISRRENLPRETAWSFSPGHFSRKPFLFYMFFWGEWREDATGRKRGNYSQLLPKIWREFFQTPITLQITRKIFFSFIFFLNKNFLKVFCRDKCMLWIQNQESGIHDLFFLPCPISFSIPDHLLSSPQLLLLFLNSCEVTGLFGELIVNTLGHTPSLRESTEQ